MIKVKLGEVIFLRKGKKADVIAEKTEQSKRYIQIDDLRNNDNLKFTESNEMTEVTPDDVLIAWDGANAGTVGYGLTGAIGSTITALKKNKTYSDKILSEYLGVFLESKSQLLRDRATGATIPHLSKDVLFGLQLKILPKVEQEIVVLTLNKIKKLIVKRQIQLQKLNDLVKSRFHEMFGDKYSEDTLLNLCNIIDYRGKTPEKVESGLPFITAKNVKMHYMSLEPREYISKEIYDKVMVRGFPKEGDVLFTTEAPLGNVCRIPNFDTEFYIGQRIVTIQTDKLNSTYLEYALSDKEFIKKYMGKSSGSTVKGIRVRLLEQLTIPVPPRVLQDEFATFVLQVDKSQLAIKKSLEELEILKKSLMQAYFG